VSILVAPPAEEVPEPPPTHASGPLVGAPTGPEAGGWRRSWLIGLATWAAAAATYVAVTALSFMVTDRAGPGLTRLYEVWDHWDTGHYMRIATIGYTADRPDTHAFFPLYPLLLRAVDWVLPGPTLAATLLLANVLLVPALAVLHRFVTRTLDRPLADRTLLVLMAWPAAFFLSAGYNASLFLLLSVSVLYCLHRRAWWWAGLLGGLASATRLAGVLLVLAFAVEYLRVRGWRWRSVRWDAAAVLVVPVGVVAFAAYCWIALDDPLAFSRAQDHWGRRLAAPWVGFGQALQLTVGRPLLEPGALHNLIDVVSVVVAATLLVFAAVGRWRLGPAYHAALVYSVASLLLVLSGPVGGAFPLQGVARYAIELVPAFVVLARLTSGRVGERLYLLPAVGIQAVFLLTFLNNVWVG
jgi:hypothetical protein